MPRCHHAALSAPDGASFNPARREFPSCPTTEAERLQGTRRDHQQKHCPDQRRRTPRKPRRRPPSSPLARRGPSRRRPTREPPNPRTTRAGQGATAAITPYTHICTYRRSRCTGLKQRRRIDGWHQSNQAARHLERSTSPSPGNGGLRTFIKAAYKGTVATTAIEAASRPAAMPKDATPGTPPKHRTRHRTRHRARQAHHPAACPCPAKTQAGRSAHPDGQAPKDAAPARTPRHPRTPRPPSLRPRTSAPPPKVIRTAAARRRRNQPQHRAHRRHHTAAAPPNPDGV